VKVQQLSEKEGKKTFLAEKIAGQIIQENLIPFHPRK